MAANSSAAASLQGPPPAYRLSVAPMMDWTDRFDRYFLRLISRRTLLYTEMITTGALIHGDAERFLAFDPAEHPVACQLGGSDPADLAKAARMVEEAGYDEVNLNVGCPSDRVQSGRFGACLMAEPELVAECVAAMRAAVSIPVTVKSRIGIDGREAYEDLTRFVATVADAGCTRFIVHARIAVLAGLSPKENREIPPLKYPWVHRLKADFPHLTVCLNGGLTGLNQVETHLAGGADGPGLDGAMIGRAAYQDPYVLAEADRRIFGDAAAETPSRHAVAHAMLEYIARQIADGVPLHHITRHILGLFNGCPGARRWRRYLSENAYASGAGPEVVEQALALVPPSADGAAAEKRAG
jgi:tRNA-dihydrouridine synthase A